jgi:hypothetical protein
MPQEGMSQNVPPCAVFHAGPSKKMNWFTTTGEGGARDAGTRPGADAMCGNAVMYDAGKIISFGGAPAYSESDATKSSILITLTGTAVATKPVGGLNVARGFANGVVLPDGKVLAVGGQARPIPFSDENSALESGVSPQLKKIRLLECCCGIEFCKVEWWHFWCCCTAMHVGRHGRAFLSAVCQEFIVLA